MLDGEHSLEMYCVGEGKKGVGFILYNVYWDGTTSYYTSSSSSSSSSAGAIMRV